MPDLAAERIFRDFYFFFPGESELKLSFKWKLCLGTVTCVIGITKGDNVELIHFISKTEIMKATEVQLYRQEKEKKCKD